MLNLVYVPFQMFSSKAHTRVNNNRWPSVQWFCKKDIKRRKDFYWWFKVRFPSHQNINYSSAAFENGDIEPRTSAYLENDENTIGGICNIWDKPSVLSQEKSEPQRQWDSRCNRRSLAGLKKAEFWQLRLFPLPDIVHHTAKILSSTWLLKVQLFLQSNNTRLNND